MYSLCKHYQGAASDELLKIMFSKRSGSDTISNNLLLVQTQSDGQEAFQQGNFFFFF